MSDIIQLLPDSIANQIAAGEVIQRPASVVKELLENAIDAGSSDIALILKDAGKTLIQVIDNGIGMSETDARMSFERHATSKLNCAEDLFKITTKGFRGEALASIAAVAHVNLKTRKEQEEIAIEIVVEGSKVINQDYCQAPYGTSMSVKNLFFNVPARRKFLKSDQIEYRHIVEEFFKVVLVHSEISFSLINNDKEVYRLKKENQRQRIVSLMGKNFNERLIPVGEDTSIVKITGFLGKPEFAKKIRGEQYFFVNKRFFRHPYFHHAVNNAYENLISKEEHASYFIYLDIDSSCIDINIHPTKTEIKFEDEKSIYSIIRSAAKLALGKFHLTPTLNFDSENTFNLPNSYKDKVPVQPKESLTPGYNPFRQESNSVPLDYMRKEKNDSSNWEQLFDVDNEEVSSTSQKVILDTDTSETLVPEKPPFQLQGKYIVASIKSGLLIINQSRAHQRILYEKFIEMLNERKLVGSQKLLFPVNIQLNALDFEVYKELEQVINQLGFETREFGKYAIIVEGIPSDIPDAGVEKVLLELLEEFKFHASDAGMNKKDYVAKSLAKKAAMPSNKKLGVEEMQYIIGALFLCQNPNISPEGKTAIKVFSYNHLDNIFEGK